MQPRVRAGFGEIAKFVQSKKKIHNETATEGIVKSRFYELEKIYLSLSMFSVPRFDRCVFGDTNGCCVKSR